MEVGRDRTEVLHPVRLRPLTPTEHISEIQTLSKQCKLGLEVISKHYDLYARDLYFDSSQDELDLHFRWNNSALSSNQRWNVYNSMHHTRKLPIQISTNRRDRWQNGLWSGYDPHTNSKLQNPKNNSTGDSKYNLRHNPKPKCND